MTERKPSAGDDIFATWTTTEREVWNAWSQVEQDVSQPGAGHACSVVLDALETSALQLARLQSAAVRGACDSLQATPLLPPPARALVEQVCRPVLSISGWQQHLVTAWFGMARHAAMSVPTGTGPLRSSSKQARESAS